MAASMSHTTPLLCRASFDRLTELSSILVNHGDLLVHSKSRERLQREVDRAENGALEAVLRLISRGAGRCSSILGYLWPCLPSKRAMSDL